VGTAAVVAGFVLTLAPVAGAVDPGGTFLDDDASVHEGAIEAVAAEGITKGCNPPDNDLFCPTAVVTRAQMASFLVRSLDLDPAANPFDDTSGSVHAADIAALAAAGITKGCNPPDNTLFCPDQPVTRAQMASFLVRALDLEPGTASFADTAGSVHGADIDALAAAGITKGCNPPDNTLFCPESPVTREQMATFLTRGLGLTPIDPPDRLPDVSTSPLVIYGSDNWLYFSRTIEQDCLSAVAFERAAEEVAKASEIVTTTGRDFVATIAPNKVTIYPEYAPDWSGSCASDNTEMLQTHLAASAGPDFVSLWRVLEMSADDGLYPKNDTHWNSAGALLAAEGIADLAAPGVWAGMSTRTSISERNGDLADILGVEWPFVDTVYTTVRTGVTSTVTDEGLDIAGRPVVRYVSPGGSGLSPATTVMIHDSMAYPLRTGLGPLFEDITFLPTFENEIPDAALPYLASADRILVERVERSAVSQWVGAGMAGRLAAAFADEFAQTSVTYSRSADNVQFTLPAPAGDALRYLVVGVDVDATYSIRLSSSLELEPDEGAWPDRLVPDTTRYGFELIGGPTTIDLPIPAAVTITEAFVITIQ
jgi:hypothetical protein